MYANNSRQHTVLVRAHQAAYNCRSAPVQQMPSRWQLHVSNTRKSLKCLRVSFGDTIARESTTQLQGTLCRDCVDKGECKT